MPASLNVVLNVGAEDKITFCCIYLFQDRKQTLFVCVFPSFLKSCISLLAVPADVNVLSSLTMRWVPLDYSQYKNVLQFGRFTNSLKSVPY